MDSRERPSGPALEPAAPKEARAAVVPVLPAQPAPLPSGRLLGARFEVIECLGGDGFTLRYRALDRRRNEHVLLAELAPMGTRRKETGGVGWEAFGEVYAFRLKHLVLDEARALGKVRAPGLARVRDSFAESGAAYLVFQCPANARTLEQEIRTSGRLPPDRVRRLAGGLAATVDALHRKGILQLRLDTESVLLCGESETLFLGLGASESWHRVFGAFGEPPHWLPPELQSAVTQRDARSDVYSLCATLYRALTGEWFPAESAASTFKVGPTPDFLSNPTMAGLWRAISRGLSAAPWERPATCDDFLRLADAPEEPTESRGSLESFDEKAVRLMTFRFRRRECPACGGLLEHARPLGPMKCPVCRDGAVRMRRFEGRLCPVCRVGALRSIRNANPLRICPSCARGLLARKRSGLFSKRYELLCQTCAARFVKKGDTVEVLCAGSSEANLTVGRTYTEGELREVSGRAVAVFACDSCEAQLDEQSAGERKLITPESPTGQSVYLVEEWLRIAAGFAPGAGNAECSECRSEYDVQEDRLTLLSAPYDPYGYAQRFLRRPVPVEAARWLGVGKRSQRPGMVCSACGTEFDQAESGLTLAFSEAERLAACVGQTHTLEDWHRIGQDLPLVAGEGQFEADFDAALVEAYERGQVSLKTSRTGAMIWRGQAVRLSPRDGEWKANGGGRLTVTSSHIRFRSLLSRAVYPLAEIATVRAEPGRLAIELSRGRRVAFQLTVVELSSKLRSGKRKVLLDAVNLARRIEAERAALAARTRDAAAEPPADPGFAHGSKSRGSAGRELL